MTRTRAVVTAAAVLALATAVERGRLGGGMPPLHAQRRPVTFTADVAPIVFRACAPCHRPDGVGPFPLLTYRDVTGHAAAIVAATRSRVMPPWKPQPGYGRFLDERRLSDSEIATLTRWAEEGAVEGDPASLPAAPSWSGQWQLGTPDLVLDIDPYTLRTAGEDVYRNFVLPVPVSSVRYIRAWEFLPGSGTVHHATMEFDPTGESRRLDEQDPEPGYEGLIPRSAMSPDGHFLGWLPGHAPNVAPPGMAWPLPPGADLIMMLHLKPHGRPETVRARLGLYFSDTPPVLQPTLIRMTRQHMEIPPGESRYVVTDTFTLDADVDLYTIQPHAHLLATEIKSYATLPNGRREWLIYIRNWDFNWQGVFRYATPPFLPAGTTVAFEYVYDNSAQNPHNPHRPPQRVSYGQHTTDEMAELWLQVVPRRPGDGPRLARAVRERVVREEIVGTEKRLASDPNNATLHDDAAMLHAEAGHWERTADHFAETARLRPASAAAQYNLGNARFRQGRVDDAVDHLRRAVALNPEYALAYDGLGVALYTRGQVENAIAAYRRALDLEPSHADAHYHLAVALRRAGRLAEAMLHYRQVLTRDPGRDAVRQELADTERQLNADVDLRR